MTGQDIHATRESREAGQIHGREWKPGDVAMVTRLGKSEVAVRSDGRPGVFDGYSAYGNGGYDDARPLVVIDPEDREQVERLRASLEDMSFSPWACGATTCLTTALRSLLAPPRPDEPTGLYARVEDDKGRTWVRTAEQSSVWRRECKNGDGLRYLIPQDGCEDYADIHAVRVLSSGVDQ